MELTTDLLKLFLPPVLVDHFKLTNSIKKGELLHLYFEELNQSPKEFDSTPLESKGFYGEITIQDFPLRGLSVYLHIKRLRWTVKSSQDIIKRDWNLVAQGTRMTEDFSAFLKEINRY